MDRVLGFGLRLAFVLCCLGYAFWGMDAQAFVRHFSGYDPKMLVVAVAGLALANWVASWKMVSLSDRKVGFGLALEGYVLGVGLNCFFPAKLGEAGKILLLRERSGLSMAAGVSLSLWDNLTQISVYFLLFQSIIGASELRAASATFAVVLGLGWAVLLILVLRPSLILALVRKVPSPALRTRGEALVQALLGRMTFRLLLLQLAISCLAALSIFLCVTAVLSAAHITLSIAQIGFVFCAATLSYLLPSSPAAVGVFEASVTTALTMLHIGKDEAIAFAVLLHLVFVVPQVLGAAVVILKGGVDIRQLVRRAKQPST